MSGTTSTMSCQCQREREREREGERGRERALCSITGVVIDWSSRRIPPRPFPQPPGLGRGIAATSSRIVSELLLSLRSQRIAGYEASSWLEPSYRRYMADGQRGR